MNKSVYCISIFVLLLSSCNKEDLAFDREEDIFLDTSLVTFQAQYVSNTTTEVSFQIDMLELNGLESETDYSDYQFLDPYSDPNYTFNLNNVTQSTIPAVSNYSTVVLLNLRNTDHYKSEGVGPYLRRFFEIVDSLPNRQVALSSFKQEENTSTRFHAEDPTDIFGNSWEYNVEQYYKLTKAADFTSGNTSGLFFKHRITGVIDSILAAPSASGDLSITLFSMWDNFGFSSFLDKEEIITKATTNNVRINLIGPEFSNDLRQIAIETGGFIAMVPNQYDTSTQPVEWEFSPATTATQNLDLLLRRNVTVHRCNVVATRTSGVFTPGELFYTKLNYSNKEVVVQFKMP